MSFTFAAADVELGTQRYPLENPDQALERIWNGLIAGEADATRLLVLNTRFPIHALVRATTMAFAHHLPLSLSPDAIWLLLMQGVAQAVAQEPELWRNASVLHDGKILLEVQADALLHAPENVKVWREALSGFSSEMHPHLAPPLRALEASFSTSSPATMGALTVARLDATREFFTLHLATACGIPFIRLEGTPDDWALIEERANMLRAFGLEWWHQALAPVLREFVRAARGEVDAAFWRSIFNHDNESGGPILSGWLLRFFPFLELRDWASKTRFIVRNHAHDRGLGEESANLWSLPGGFSRAPFSWSVGAEIRDMEWLGGFAGVAQDDEGTLRSALGWAARPNAI